MSGPAKKCIDCARLKEDLPPRASKNWEILEREVLKIATARRGDCHSDSVHSYSDQDGCYTRSGVWGFRGMVARSPGLGFEAVRR